MIDGKQYLVNEEGLVFTYNIESPVFIGHKTKKGTIKKIENTTVSSIPEETAVTN